MLLIDVGGKAIPDDDKIPSSLRVVEDHDGTLSDVTSRPASLTSNIGIEYRGAWSLQFPKKGYSLELRDAAGSESEQPFLDMPADSDWVLRAGYYDRTLMRDALGFWLFSDVWRRYAPRFRFVEVYVDGSYEGVYLACEKISRGKNRVDLPKVAPDAASGDLTGGYIVHIESGSGPGFQTSTGRIWEYGYPSAASVTEAQAAYLTAYLSQFEEAMASDGFADPATGYPAWLDVPSAVDFALFQELARNTDGYTKSSYYQKSPDSAGGKLTAGPIWDNDLSFGNFANGTEDPEGWQYQFSWNEPVPWWPRLLGNATFQNLTRCRWQSLRSGGLTVERIDQKLEEFATILSKAQPREDARWHLIGQRESRSAYVGATWQDDITYLKRWINQRIAWLDAQLSGACEP